MIKTSSGLWLNLGCSDRHFSSPWVNVDLAEPADQIADLNFTWPWDDSSVNRILAHDILEHLYGSYYSKAWVMHEVWRVLEPGGIIDLVVPTTDGRGAFQDPTHRTFWTPNDLRYFVGGYPEYERFGRAYAKVCGLDRWPCFHEALVEHSEFPDKVWKLHAQLIAKK